MHEYNLKAYNLFITIMLLLFTSIYSLLACLLPAWAICLSIKKNFTYHMLRLCLILFDLSRHIHTANLPLSFQGNVCECGRIILEYIPSMANWSWKFKSWNKLRRCALEHSILHYIAGILQMSPKRWYIL